MARHNIAYLMGAVLQDPTVVKKPDGTFSYAMVYLSIARGLREVGDKKKYLKIDHPVIMAREEEIVKEIASWKQYDIVEIKGTIATKNIKKVSYCENPECVDETGQKRKNYSDGTLVYINPIFAKQRVHKESKEECLEFLKENREISNQVHVLGELCRDPKKVKPKEGLVVTQYPIALNRKFRIRTDPPEIRTDYPWVKSYGENAISDRERLHIGSIVLIDGCLQARAVNRHAVCPFCGNKYDWKDRAMEIVPFDTEYMPGTFYTDEEVARIAAERAEQAKRDTLGNKEAIPEDEDVYSEEDISAGIESEESI